MRTSVLLILAVAVAGCLQIDVGSGVLKCSTDPNRLCPEGFFCASDGKCWKNGDIAPAAKHKGTACTLANECDTGHCVDGVCCDSACNGQCQACDGTGGVCRTITGTPHRGRASCPTAGFDACASFCDGSDGMKCTFPGSSATCGFQACFGPPPTLKSATVCDGAGGCVPLNGGMLTTPCPTPPGGTAICAGDQCDFTCNPPYQRQGSTCVLGDMG